jgi:hypothetical protein
MSTKRLTAKKKEVHFHLMGEGSRTVLLVGRDDTLLMTRAQILDGIATTLPAHPDEAEALLKARAIDLVLLCQSLGDEEKARILAAASLSASATRSLNLVRTMVPDSRPCERAVLVPIGPHELIASVNALLAGC